MNEFSGDTALVLAKYVETLLDQSAVLDQWENLLQTAYAKAGYCEGEIDLLDLITIHTEGFHRCE